MRWRRGFAEKKPMDRNQARAALLKITLLVLAGTSWLFTSFLFASRPDAPAADPLTTLVRLPASLPAGLPQTMLFPATSRRNDPIRMDVVDLSCWDSHPDSEQPVTSRWVLLTGRSCQSPRPADKVTVRNLANGYEATVFAALSPAAYTTDFIPLQPGPNEILIRFEEEPGVAVEYRFQFRRDDPPTF